MSERWVLLGIAVTAVSGVPGLFMDRRSMRGQRWALFLAGLGALLGLGGIGLFWAAGAGQPVALAGSPFGGTLSAGLDGLSAIFLAPVFGVSLAGGVYGLGYWRQTDHPENGRGLRLFYGLLTAGMALLVIARDAILFLFGWEIMALSAFFLVTVEDREPGVRRTGLVYLAATHTATLCLFALFALLHAASGSFALVPLEGRVLAPGTATAVFVLALGAFGMKAGLMPLHLWLPGAHAATPSHVSALMSGVILKMGVYGLVRVTSILPDPPPSWGGALLALGAASGILGIAFALAQRDLKRMLAYSSIENVGLLAMGLGLALLGRSAGRADWIVLGLGGCLLHVWNHALFKALLFLGAGSAIHAAGSREIDRLGGLAKKMPWTALCFGAGAAAVCGLPPLNGFAGEFLLFLGFFGILQGAGGVSAALAAPALALIGALAAACFVKTFGVVFLGTARTRSAQEARESPPSMLWPMGALAAACLGIGLAPGLIAPLLERGISAWAPNLIDPAFRIAPLAPLGWISILGLALIAAWAAVSALLRMRLGHVPVWEGPTWNCGFAAPTSRMQYTSSSFARMLTGMFGWALRPRVRRTGLPLFPGYAAFVSRVPDTVLDRAVLPAFRRGARASSALRVLQRGNVQAYLLYLFIALAVLLLWTMKGMP